MIPNIRASHSHTALTHTRTTIHPISLGTVAGQRPATRPRRRVDWMTWWSWRGARTRSHPELGRENPQHPWYCASRHGRVGRRQVFQSTQSPRGVPGDLTPAPLRGHQHTYPATTAGWSSPVARQAHNLKVTGSNPVPATNHQTTQSPPFQPATGSLQRCGRPGVVPLSAQFHT